MIVDSNAEFRNEFVGWIAKSFRDLRLRVSNNGDDALSAIDSDQPMIVFANVRLNGSNGLCLIEKLKTRYPAISCVLLSHYDDPEYADASKSVCADLFVDCAEVNRDEVTAFVYAKLRSIGKSTEMNLDYSNYP